jgi:hypothetical protein
LLIGGTILLVELWSIASWIGFNLSEVIRDWKGRDSVESFSKGGYLKGLVRSALTDTWCMKGDDI